MARRYLLFFALALPLYIGTMYYIQKQERLRREYEKHLKLERDEQAGDDSPTNGNGAPAEPQPTSLGTPSPKGTFDGARAEQREWDEPAERPVADPVVIQTQSMRITISPVGAVPVQWEIIDPRFLNSHKSKGGGEGSETETNTVALIDPSLDAGGMDRPLEIALKELNGKYYNRMLNDALYSFERDEDDEAITYRFTSPRTESGLQLIKTYRVPKTGFLIEHGLKFINDNTSELSFKDPRGHGLGIALGPGLGLPPHTNGGKVRRSRYDYTNAFCKTSSGINNVRQTKLADPKILEDELGGLIRWGGVHNRYFMMCLIPKADGFQIGLTSLDPGVADSEDYPAESIAFYPRIELYEPEFDLPPNGGSKQFDFTIFAGPKTTQVLDASGFDLREILFYGTWKWMRVLCFGLMALLKWFHVLMHSWGLAIIAVVVTVRLLTFPLVHRGLKSQAKVMADQARIKPHMDKINTKYKDNSRKRNEEMMKLYREHGVNPFGAFKGCLWMIIQLPIFFALYRLLSQSFDLRGASFLWIDDLSQPDRLFQLGVTLPFIGNDFNLLPILTAATQVVMSKLSTNPAGAADSTQAAMQKQMMYMMPVMILFMTYNFPSGLVLYWLVSNIWQTLQQRFVNKKILGKSVPGDSKAADAVAA